MGVVLQDLAGVEEGTASAYYDSFFQRTLSCVQCIVNSVFDFADFDFRPAAYLDDRYAALEFGQSLAQLLFVLVRSGQFDL